MLVRLSRWGLAALGLAACGGDDARPATDASSAEAGGTGGTLASSSIASSSASGAAAGGRGGEGAAEGGGGGDGGGAGSPQTGPDAIAAERFTGGDVCWRELTRVAAAPDGWVVAGSVQAEEADLSAPCSITIGSVTITAAPYAQWSVSFLAKLGLDGTPQWLVEYEMNKATPEVIKDLVVDSQGFTHVIGRPYSSFTLDPFEITSGRYLLTIDPNGVPVAVEETDLPPLPEELVLDASDNLYYGTSKTITKLAPDGTQLATTSFDFGGVTGDTLSGLAVDGAGNVFFTGPAYTVGDSSVGVAKLDPNLNTLWSYVIGGSDPQSSFGLAVDAADGLMMIGTYGQSASFGGPALTGVSDEWDPNGFLLGLDGAGGHRFSFGFGHEVTHDCCNRGPRIAAMPGGGVVIAGGAESAALDFGQGALPVTVSGELFLARIEGSGTAKWARTFGPNARAYDVAVAADGTIAVVGTIRAPVDFGTGTLPVSSLGYGDAFVAVFPPE